MSLWTIPLVVGVVGGLALVLIDPRRCRTTRILHLVLTLTGRWLANAGLLVWIVVSWQRTTRNLGLAYSDKHAVKRTRTWDRAGVMTEREHPRITYPWVVPRLDSYGVVLTVWTRVGVGREEFENVAGHLADVWRCRRVHVSQHTPGRLTVRALRRDPLASRLSLPLHTAPEMEQGDDDDAAPADRAA